MRAVSRCQLTQEAEHRPVKRKATETIFQPCPRRCCNRQSSIVTLFVRVTPSCHRRFPPGCTEFDTSVLSLRFIYSGLLRLMKEKRARRPRACHRNCIYTNLMDADNASGKTHTNTRTSTTTSRKHAEKTPRMQKSHCFLERVCLSISFFCRERDCSAKKMSKMSNSCVGCVTGILGNPP